MINLFIVVTKKCFKVLTHGWIKEPLYVTYTRRLVTKALLSVR